MQWKCALVVLLLVAAGTASASPRRVPLAPPATEVTFRAYGLGLLPLDGRFAQFAGWLDYDPANAAACRVDLQVTVHSLVADDGAPRDIMVGPDFLDADQFPVLRYTGTCDPTGALTGMLTMHGVSRPFALGVTWTANRVVAEGSLLRADWGMTARPLLGGRTVRIRVTVPLDAQSSHGG